jgi:hypothetical protein
MAKNMDLEKLRESARKLIMLIDTKNDWVGLMPGQMAFHDLLNGIRWEIDGEESEVLRTTGCLEKYLRRG